MLLNVDPLLSASLGVCDAVPQVSIAITTSKFTEQYKLSRLRKMRYVCLITVRTTELNGPFSCRISLIFISSCLSNENSG